MLDAVQSFGQDDRQRTKETIINRCVCPPQHLSLRPAFLQIPKRYFAFSYGEPFAQTIWIRFLLVHAKYEHTGTQAHRHTQTHSAHWIRSDLLCAVVLRVCNAYSNTHTEKGERMTKTSGNAEEAYSSRSPATDRRRSCGEDG